MQQESATAAETLSAVELTTITAARFEEEAEAAVPAAVAGLSDVGLVPVIPEAAGSVHPAEQGLEIMVVWSRQAEQDREGTAIVWNHRVEHAQEMVLFNACEQKMCEQ